MALGGRDLPDWFSSVVVLLAPALLAALVVTQTLRRRRSAGGGRGDGRRRRRRSRLLAHRVDHLVRARLGRPHRRPAGALAARYRDGGDGQSGRLQGPAGTGRRATAQSACAAAARRRGRRDRSWWRRAPCRALSPTRGCCSWRPRSTAGRCTPSSSPGGCARPTPGSWSCMPLWRRRASRRCRRLRRGSSAIASPRVRAVAVPRGRACGARPLVGCAARALRAADRAGRAAATG